MTTLAGVVRSPTRPHHRVEHGGGRRARPSRRIAARSPGNAPRRPPPRGGTDLGDDDLGNDDDTLEALYKSSLGVVTRLLDAQTRHPDDQDQLEVRSDELSDWTSTVRPSLIRLTLSEPPPLRLDDYYGNHSDRQMIEREGMRYSIRFLEALCTFARLGDDSVDAFDLTGVVEALDSTLVDLGYMSPPPSEAEDGVDGEEGARGIGRPRRHDALDTFLRAGGEDGEASLEAWYREATSPRGNGEEDGIAHGSVRSGKRAKLSHNRRLRSDYHHDNEEDADEKEREERRMIRLGAMLSLPWVLAHGHHRFQDDDTTSPPTGPESSSSGVSSSSRKRKARSPQPPSLRTGHRGNLRRRDDRKKWRSELLYILSRFVSTYQHDHQSQNFEVSYRDVVVPSTRTFRDLLGLSASDCDVALACHALDSLKAATTKEADAGEEAGGGSCGGGGGITPEVALGEVLRPGVLSELSSYVTPPRGIVGNRDRLRIHGRNVALCAVARCLLGAGGAALAGRCALELWKGCGMDASSLLSRSRGSGMEGASSTSSTRPPRRRRFHRSSAAAAPPSDQDDDTLWLVVQTELSILLSAGRTEEACLLVNLASRGGSGDGGNAMTTKTTQAADLGRESWGRIFEAVSSAAAATARRDSAGDGRGREEATLASLQDMLHVFPIGPVGQRLLLERLNADMDMAGKGGRPQLVGNIQKLMYCFLVARTDPISAFSSAFDIDWWKLSLAASDADFDVTGESLAFLLNDVDDGATGAAAPPVAVGETPVHEGSEDQTPSAPAGVAPPPQVTGDEVLVATSEEKSAVEKDVHSKTVSDEAPHSLTGRDIDAAKSSRAVTPVDAVAKKRSAAAAALEMRQPTGDLQPKHITVGEHVDNGAQREQTCSTKIGDSVEENRLREARREEAGDFGDVMGVDDRVSQDNALEGTAKPEKDGAKERSEDEASERIVSAQKDRGEHQKRLEDTPQRNIEAQSIVETAPEVIRIRDKRSARENLNQEEEEGEVEVLVVEENVEEEDVETEVQVAEECVDEEEVEAEVKEDDVNDDVDEEDIDEVYRGEDSGAEDGSDASSLQDEGDYFEKSDGSQPSDVGSESHLSDEVDDNESIVVIDDDEDAEEPSKGMADEEADDEAMSVGSRVSDASVTSASARGSSAEETSPRSRDECSEAEDDETIDEEAEKEEVDFSGTKVQEQRVVSSEKLGLEQHRLEEVGGVAAGDTEQEAAIAEARLEPGIRKEEEQVTEAKVEEEYLAKLKSAEYEGEMYVEGERKEEERLEMSRESAAEQERAAAEQKILEQQRRDEEKRLARLQEQEERRERVAVEKARLEEERRKEEQRAAAEKAEEERIAELKLKEEERKRAETLRLEREEEERREMLRVEAEEREQAAAEHARLEQQRREEEERLARLKEQEEEQERAAAERARLEDERRKEEERAAAEKAEKERLAELKLVEQKRKSAEQARLEQNRREEEERRAAEKAEEERLAKLREKEKEEQQRVAAEKERGEQKEEERVAAAKAEAERLKVEAERLATWREQNMAKGQEASKQAKLLHKHHKEEEDLAAGEAEEENVSKFFEQDERRKRAAVESTTMEEKLPGEREHLAAEKREKPKEHKELGERKAAEQARMQKELAKEEELFAAEKALERGQEGDMGTATHGGLDQGHGEEGAELERIAKKEEQERIALARSKAEEFRKQAEASRLASATKKAKQVDRRKDTESDDRKIAAHKKPKGKRQRDEADGYKGGHTSKDSYVGAVAKASSPLEVLSPKSTRMSGPSPHSAGSSLRSTPGIIGTSITFDNSGFASERLSLGTTTSMSVVAPPVSTRGDDEGGIVMRPRDTATIRQPSESVEEDTSDALSLSTLNAMKVAELRMECENRGLSTTGHKADLLHRLREEIRTGQTVSSFNSMKYEDLRKKCVELGLDRTGRKADLVARLEANSSLARDADPRKRLQDDGSVAASVSSFSSMRYIDLREECKRRGLASSGHKADLVARLENSSSVARKADSMKLQEDSSVGQSVASFSSKKVVELREDCRRLGLDRTGNKSDLVARLEANAVARKDDPQKRPQEDSSAAKSVSSFISMKYEELRKECRRRGLDTKGHKADLAARLEASSSVAHTVDKKVELQEDSSVAESFASFGRKTVADLRKDCERLGMDSTGTKSELIARLEENTSVAQSVSSLNSIKVSELRGLCTRRGLDSRGKRTDLVERLQEYSPADQWHLDYESMTLADLQEEYKYVGLDGQAFTSKKVSKADLVALLEEHVAKQPHARKGKPKGASKPPLPPSSLHLDKKRRAQTSSTPSSAAVKRLRSSSEADSTGNQGYRDQNAKPPLPPSSTGKAKNSKSVKSKGTPSSAGTVRTTRSSVRTTRSRSSK